MSPEAIEKEVYNNIEVLRNIEAPNDKKEAEKNNKLMDKQWKFYSKNKEEILPLIDSCLFKEIENEKPNDLILLDLGYYLYLNGTDEQKKLAILALYSINTNQQIINMNFEQFFRFTHAVASDRDENILNFLDAKYLLNNTNTVFLLLHSLSLNPTKINIFLYGVYGSESEEHLLNQIDNSDLQNEILNILCWIGSPKSVNKIKMILDSNYHFDTFFRCIHLLMEVGGPEGKDIIQNIDIEKYDNESKEFYLKIKPFVDSLSFEFIKSKLETQMSRIEEIGIYTKKDISNDELKGILKKMYDNNGRDNTTNPLVILNSKLSKKFLIDELLKIRASTFKRISDEALSDVEITNYLINSLRYRE